MTLLELLKQQKESRQGGTPNEPNEKLVIPGCENLRVHVWFAKEAGLPVYWAIRRIGKESQIRTTLRAADVIGATLGNFVAASYLSARSDVPEGQRALLAKFLEGTKGMFAEGAATAEVNGTAEPQAVILQPNI